MATSRQLYDDTLQTAKMAERTARDWRAANKLNTDAYSKYLTKLRKQGERLKLRDLYRLGRPAQKRAAVGTAAKLTGEFPVLYADPPWKYEHPPMGSTARSIEAKYPTLTLEKAPSGRAAVSLPAAGKSKRETLKSAGLSTSAANRYEKIADIPEEANRSNSYPPSTRVIPLLLPIHIAPCRRIRGRP